MAFWTVIISSLTILTVLIVLAAAIGITILHRKVISRDKSINVLREENRKLTKKIIATIVDRDY